MIWFKLWENHQSLVRTDSGCNGSKGARAKMEEHMTIVIIQARNKVVWITEKEEVKGIQSQIYFKNRAKRFVDWLDRVCGKIKRTPWSQERQGLGWGRLIKGRMELSFTEKGIIGNGEHILWRRSKTGSRYVNLEMNIWCGHGDGM